MGAEDAALRAYYEQGLEPGRIFSPPGWRVAYRSSTRRSVQARETRSVWLTSVDSAGFDAGRLAARTLLARVADPSRPAGLHLLPPALQVRGSTAAPPSP